MSCDRAHDSAEWSTKLQSEFTEFSTVSVRPHRSSWELSIEIILEQMQTCNHRKMIEFACSDTGLNPYPAVPPHANLNDPPKKTQTGEKPHALKANQVRTCTET